VADGAAAPEPLAGSGHDINGDLIACDTALLNRFLANYVASDSQTR
jgi:hypothetical protein